MRWILALVALFCLTGARDPILVPDVSQHEIQLRQGFTGTELLLFGAILNPEGTRAGRDYDIVVVLKGPTQSVVVREKQKTNIRTHASDDAIKLTPPRVLTLESAIEFIADDELVEVTPAAIRVRKRRLREQDRRRAR